MTDCASNPLRCRDALRRPILALLEANSHTVCEIIRAVGRHSLSSPVLNQRIRLTIKPASLAVGDAANIPRRRCPELIQSAMSAIRSSSRLQNLRHIPRDGLFKLARLRVQFFEFLVQRFELLFEVFVADGFAGSDADVAARIKRPALGFDLFQSGDFAETGNIPVFWIFDSGFWLCGRQKISVSFALASSPPRVKSSSSPR